MTFRRASASLNGGVPALMSANALISSADGDGVGLGLLLAAAEQLGGRRALAVVERDLHLAAVELECAC